MKVTIICMSHQELKQICQVCVAYCKCVELTVTSFLIQAYNDHLNSMLCCNISRSSKGDQGIRV